MIDKLFESVKEKGHVCIGLDTCVSYIPELERKKAASDADAVFNFNKELIEATFDVAACYKVQIAYYEEMGILGLEVYAKTLRYIHKKGRIVIADIKRGDIADTAIRYANAHYKGDFEADFVTLSPYMGMDSIEPWLEVAKKNKKGAFVLMRTSNPGMKDFEYLELKNGGKVYHAVGDKLSNLAEQNKGKCGYGLFGAVVGCTETEEAAQIRAKYPNLFFLIPGYGAQGGAANDAALLLREGNGGVVNSSRAILTAWKKSLNETNGAENKANNAFAAERARKAAETMRDSIRAAK